MIRVYFNLFVILIMITLFFPIECLASANRVFYCPDAKDIHTNRNGNHYANELVDGIRINWIGYNSSARYLKPLSFNKAWTGEGSINCYYRSDKKGVWINMSPSVSLGDKGVYKGKWKWGKYHQLECLSKNTRDCPMSFKTGFEKAYEVVDGMAKGNVF